MTHILSIFEVHDKNPDDVNSDIEIISAGMFFCMLKFKRIRVSLVYQKKSVDISIDCLFQKYLWKIQF